MKIKPNGDAGKTNVARAKKKTELGRCRSKRQLKTTQQSTGDV